MLPLLAAALLAACGGEDATVPAPATEPVPATGSGWPRFGYDAARSNVFPGSTGITAENVQRLRRQQVALPGTADSSPIFIAPSTFVVTTSYGKAVAVDADSGEIRWTFVPEGLESWEGTSQITQAGPVDDPETPFLYSYSPDGRVHKLEDETGREVRSEGWPAVVTKDQVREKSAPPLNLAGGLVLLATGGYLGDAPPYQGHVVAIDADSGRLVNVFNTLCSEREGVLEPSACPEWGSAIWGRGGVVVEPGTGNLLVSTGNGEWNGSTHWGDSVLELTPDAGRILQNYTPENEEELDTTDQDLSSASPAFVPPHFVVQGGKEGLLRLLDLRRLNGEGGAAAHKGGELATVEAPGEGGVHSAPAVWQNGGEQWVFVANSSGTAAYVVRDADIDRQWENETPGTSPVLAGGLLYVYDHSGGGLNVCDPESGRRLANLPAGTGHWSSPIVIDGRIALPDGSANDHASEGVLNIYRLP